MSTQRMNSSLPTVDPGAVRARGYAIVRRVFPPEEVGQLRAATRQAVAELEHEGRMVTFLGPEGAARGGGGDLLGIPQLRRLVYDPRILSVAEQLLGGQPVYFGDSTFRLGKSGIRGWHRDCANRRRWRGGPDWHGPPYPLLRCGIYLQDQAYHSGGLALRPYSNQLGTVRPTLPKLVNTAAGDLVVWDLRTVHSGEVVRLRGLPWLPLHPRLQARLPQRLRIPDDGERVVLFIAYGCAGAHLDRYIEFLKRRGDMYESWACTRFGPDVWAAAEEAGLRMLAPIEEYDHAPPKRAAT